LTAGLFFRDIDEERILVKTECLKNWTVSGPVNDNKLQEMR